MAAPRDYDTVAKALRYLEENFRRQPSLHDLASHVGLSRYHFQRLFTRWAGVSPKRFLQFLTVEYAKERLRDSEPVLQAAFSSGLSGPARLHDLLISAEGVTPGEFKTGGGGLTMRWGLHETPFGPACLALTDRGLSHLSFLETGDAGEVAGTIGHLRDRWPNASLLEDPGATAIPAEAIFRSDGPLPTCTSLSLFLKGTNFQMKVWNALLRIPPGSITTYGRLAQTLGTPSAARAVGGAVARNPVGFLIPCHRVIREMGVIGEYRWDPVRKRAILGWEAAQQAS